MLVKSLTVPSIREIDWYWNETHGPPTESSSKGHIPYFSERNVEGSHIEMPCEEQRPQWRQMKLQKAMETLTKKYQVRGNKMTFL